MFTIVVPVIVYGTISLVHGIVYCLTQVIKKRAVGNRPYIFFKDLNHKNFGFCFIGYNYFIHMSITLSY